MLVLRERARRQAGFCCKKGGCSEGLRAGGLDTEEWETVKQGYSSCLGAGGPWRGGPWVQALCSLWAWWAELRPSVAPTYLTVHSPWGAPHPGPLPGQVGCSQEEEIAPWESPPQPQSRPRARLGGAGTTREVPLTLRLTLPIFEMGRGECPGASLA